MAVGKPAARSTRMGDLLRFIVLVAATALIWSAAPREAAASGTCSFDFGTVAYGSTNNIYVMSESKNASVLASCDPRYPDGNSGVANPDSGPSSNSGNWSAVTNPYDNTVTYSAPPGFAGPDSFTMYFCNETCDGNGRLTATVTVTVVRISVDTASVPDGTRGTAYGPVTLTASGGAAPYSFSVSGGSLPAGMSLSEAGILSGTPTEIGTFTFEAKAQDSSTGRGPFSGTRSYSLSIAESPPVANSVSATVAANSSGSPITLNITGGTPTSVATPTLPTNGSVTIAGTSITYTPTAGYSGADSFTYTATNVDGTSAAATVSLTVSRPTLSLAAISTSGVASTPYSATVVASLGTAPYTFTKSSGTLPPGLTLQGGGALAGTPTAPGSFTFEVEATDTHGATGTRSYTVAIAAPTIAITSPAAGALPAATAGSGGYSQTFAASGGAGAHTFEVTAGALPAGLTLSQAGVLSGTPTAAGTFNFSVTPSDSSPAPGPFSGTARSYSLTVGKAVPTVALSAPSINLVVGTSVTFTAPLAGGASPSGTVTFKDGATTLGTGTIVGTTATFSTAALTLGSHSITAVYDGDSNNATVTSAVLTVTVGQAAPTVTVSAPSNSAFGATVTFTATLAGGVSAGGTVTFKEGATPLGAGTIVGTTATFTTSALTLGSHSITAEYSGDANNAAAISGPVIVTVGQAAPTISVAASDSNPAVGATVTFTATLAGGVAPGGTVTFKDGAATLGTGTISGGAASFSTIALAVGSHSVTAEYGGDSNNATATSAAVTVTVGQAAPTIAVTTSDSNPTLGASVTFTATLAGGVSAGGTVTFKDGAAPLGAGTIVGTTATFTTSALTLGSHSITAEYSGDANNAAATSAAAAVTVGQAAPTISVSASDSNPAVGATVTFTATLAGGSSPGGTVTFKDGAATLGTGTISGAMATFSTTALGVGSHSITAEYGGDTNNAATTSAALTVAVGQATPTIALSASDSNPVLGTSVTFTATLAGGVAPGGTVTFKDGATTLGTAAISGSTTTFSTAMLAVGPHSVTAEYGGDSNNATATSAAVTVTVGQAAPTIALSASDSNPTLGASVTFTATLAGGVAPGGTVTFKDGAATLGTGTISGTTATFSASALTVGSHSVTAEYGGDANNAAATSAAVAVKVTAAAVFAFTPAGGALSPAMAGEDYSQPISATGGTGSLTYRLASGALPAGVVLNLSTGELTGPLDENAAVKDHGFTIEVRDSNGATGAASYSLNVTERVVAVTDKAIDMSAGGTPANVDLQSGATGGPFTEADVVFVEPANAGSASIVRGEFAQAGGPTPLGWYLKFIPDPAFSGTARVGFKLTSALGVSNTGTVIYELGYAPAEVADEIDGLVHGFVQTRQSMIASTIKVPGLLERRQAQNAAEPVTTRMMPSEEGLTASFSTSLAQMEAARDNADGVAEAQSLPVNIWIDGTLMVHNREENDGKWGGFGMVNLGADYLISEKALIGVSFHYDRMTDPTDEDAKLTGNGWLAGPYASFELGKGVFWDTSLLYGGSANDIDTTFWDGSFDTTRWMIDTAIKGTWQLDDVTVLTPKLRAVYFNEKVKDYTVSNATGDELTIEGFDTEQFRVSLGAEIARSFMLANGSTLTPKLGVTGGYAGLDGSGAYGSLTTGLALNTADFWILEAGLLFNIEGDGQKSAGGGLRAAKQF